MSTREHQWSNGPTRNDPKYGALALAVVLEATWILRPRPDRIAGAMTANTVNRQHSLTRNI
eukprot:5616873-Amphidinium_carterae.1